MATPFLQVATTPITLRRGSVFSMLVPTLDAAGNPVNVSSGYTVKDANVFPAAQANLVPGPIDVASSLSFSFGATGVTISGTQAQVDGIINAREVTQYNFGLSISNDSGTTKSTLLLAPLTLIPAYGQIS